MWTGLSLWLELVRPSLLLLSARRSTFLLLYLRGRGYAGLDADRLDVNR